MQGATVTYDSIQGKGIMHQTRLLQKLSWHDAKRAEVFHTIKVLSRAENLKPRLLAYLIMSSKQLSVP